MPTIHELVEHADRLLAADVGGDHGPNGLQVEGTREVRKIVSGVSACVDLFQRARERGADVVLVHHGILWDSLGAKPLTGGHGRRVRWIVESGMHLVAYHLPLDRHDELGNNVLAARSLGLSALQPWCEFRGAPVGFRGIFPEPVEPDELVRRCRETFEWEPLAFLEGPERIASVGIVSGGAQGEIHRAIADGLDAFVTGEVSEWVLHVAKEAGIHFLSCGHHATERAGVRALGERLAERFDLDHEFVDVPNPV